MCSSSKNCVVAIPFLAGTLARRRRADRNGRDWKKAQGSNYVGSGVERHRGSRQGLSKAQPRPCSAKRWWRMHPWGAWGGRLVCGPSAVRAAGGRGRRQPCSELRRRRAVNASRFPREPQVIRAGGEGLWPRAQARVVVGHPRPASCSGPRFAMRGPEEGLAQKRRRVWRHGFTGSRGTCRVAGRRRFVVGQHASAPRLGTRAGVLVAGLCRCLLPGRPRASSRLGCDRHPQR